jgi:hypothetical protein
MRDHGRHGADGGQHLRSGKLGLELTDFFPQRNVGVFLWHSRYPLGSLRFDGLTLKTSAIHDLSNDPPWAGKVDAKESFLFNIGQPSRAT